MILTKIQSMLFSAMCQHFKNVLIVLFFPLLSNSQHCFIVYDFENRLPVPFVTVWKGETIYSNADRFGKFFIEQQDIGSPFTISCIGYKNKTINFNSDSILIKRSPIVLEEVIISKSIGRKKEKLGNLDNRDIDLVATSELKIAELGMPFVSKKNTSQYLNGIKFRAFASSNSRSILLKVYSLNSENLPDSLLTQQTVNVPIKKGNKINEFAFYDKKILIPKPGCFISLQILLIEENKSYAPGIQGWFFYEPSISAAKSDLQSYYTLDQIGVWKKHEKAALAMQILLSD